MDLKIRGMAMAALLSAALAVSGCSIADMPGLGTPSDAPARPKEVGAYLPVHDVPPERDEQALKPAERQKIELELKAARDQQAAAAAQNAAAK